MEKEEELLLQLINKYESYMLAIAKKILGDIGNDMDAADCVWISISYIWKNIYNFSSDNKYLLKKWIGSVVACRTINHRLKLIRDSDKQRRFFELNALNFNIDIEEIVILNDNKKKLYCIFNEFESPQKEILIYRIIYELTPEKISKLFDLELNKVYYYIKVGKSKFRKKAIEVLEYV